MYYGDLSMKKLTLAIAITALTTGAANAKTFTAEDGSSLAMTGELELSLGKATAADSELALETNGIDLGFVASYPVSDDMKIFSNFAFNMSNDPDTGTTVMNLKKAFLGFKVSDTTITLGKHTYASDEFGIGEDKSFGVSGALGSTGGNDTLKVSYSGIEDTLIIASTNLPESGDESSLDVFVQYSLPEIVLAATVQSQKANEDADSMTYLGLSGVYSGDGFTAAGEYTLDAESEVSAIEIAGTYAMDDSMTLGAGVGSVMPSGGDAVTGYYLNTTYSVASNASAYAEIGGSTEDDSELGLVIGAAVSF